MENGSGLSSAGLPVMERQGSRMQVDEDSRNARYQTDTFRMLGYKASPRECSSGQPLWYSRLKWRGNMHLIDFPACLYSTCTLLVCKVERITIKPYKPTHLFSEWYSAAEHQADDEKLVSQDLRVYQSSKAIELSWR